MRTASGQGPSVAALPSASAPAKSGNHSRHRFFFVGRLNPASRHRPVHTNRTTARSIASPQNSTSGLLRSETMRSRPVGGSKAFCGRRSMFLTGAWGKEILLSAVRTKRAAVTARQKSPGRRFSRRLIAAAPGGRAAGGRGRSEPLPQPVHDEVEPELELGVAVHLAEPVPEHRDVGELFGR